MNSKLPILIFSLTLFGVHGFENLLIAQSDSITVESTSKPEASEAELREANSKYRQAKENYQTQLRLAKRGSVSKLELKRARLEKEIAGLTLGVLRDPSKAASNQVEIARLNYEFEQQDLATANRLLKSGSISKLQYRRKNYRFKLAEIRLKAATGEISGDVAKLLIARREVGLAEAEMELGKKLFKARSITQSTMQQLTNRLESNRRQLNELEQLQKKKKEAIKRKTRT